jgi:hypothetical protein
MTIENHYLVQPAPGDKVQIAAINAKAVMTKEAAMALAYHLVQVAGDMRTLALMFAAENPPPVNEAPAPGQTPDPAA